MNSELSLLSVCLLLPTFIGFWIGENIRKKMSEIIFKKFILFIFLFMGLDLIRRAYF